MKKITGFAVALSIVFLSQLSLAGQMDLMLRGLVEKAKAPAAGKGGGGRFSLRAASRWERYSSTASSVTEGMASNVSREAPWGFTPGWRE